MVECIDKIEYNFELSETIPTQEYGNIRVTYGERISINPLLIIDCSKEKLQAIKIAFINSVKVTYLQKKEEIIKIVETTENMK